MRRFIKIVLVTVTLFIVAFIALVFLPVPVPDCTDNERDHCSAAYTFSNGDIYDGEWVDKKKQGHGTLIAAHGSKYIGEFWKGKFHGKGTLITADGATYVGEFKRGRFDGEGTLINKYGTVGKGIWQDNDLYGQGTLTWANGDRYVGDFKDNLINGRGTLTSLDGEKYIGQFKDHQKNGQGTLTAADGTVTEGIWRDNKFQYSNRYEADEHAGPGLGTIGSESAPSQHGATIYSATSEKSEDECLIDGDTVTLSGIPSLEVFPGRPEYKSIEEGDEERWYWILNTKKYTCGMRLSYESGELYQVNGDYSSFQLANYNFSEKMLSNPQNNKIVNGKGVITITGQIMFGHNANHVTPVVLFDGVLDTQDADDIVTLKETDGHH